MKRKLLAVGLTLVMLCGAFTAAAYAEPVKLWENWELRGVFGFGHDEDGKLVKWMCSKVGTRLDKMFTVRGFETKEEADRFMENCFTDREKESLLTKTYENGYGYDQTVSEKIFKDKLFHPVIELDSFDINKTEVYSINKAFRIDVEFEGVPDKLKGSVKAKWKPWIKHARTDDEAEVTIQYPHDRLTLTGFKYVNKGNAAILSESGDTVSVRMGTDNLKIIAVFKAV